MKKKKGFTLVELLAVIAILAILVIMALPVVLRMYRQSRINTFQNETRSVYRTAQSQFLGDSMLLGSGQKILYTNGCTSSSDADVVKALDMTGNSNFKYYVLIDVDGKVLEVRSTNGTYSYSKTGVDLKVEDMDVETYNDSELDSDISSTICTMESSGGSSSGSGSGSSTPSATNVATCATPGCTKTSPETELIIGGENFYVVSSDSTNTVLLAKYDLKSDGSGSYTQDTTGTNTNIVLVNFLDSNNTAYWDGCEYSFSSWSCTGTSGLKSGYANTANAAGTTSYTSPYPEVYDSNAVNIYPVVESYVNKIGTSVGTAVTGTLMTYEQANSLSTNVRKDMNNRYYWIGSAFSQNGVWGVSGGGIGINNASNFGGVRPVIIVSTSDL